MYCPALAQNPPPHAGLVMSCHSHGWTALTALAIILVPHLLSPLSHLVLLCPVCYLAELLLTRAVTQVLLVLSYLAAVIAWFSNAPDARCDLCQNSLLYQANAVYVWAWKSQLYWCLLCSASRVVGWLISRSSPDCDQARSLMGYFWTKNPGPFVTDYIALRSPVIGLSM